ncbi:hypothetical protein B0H13DRAFT_1929843 [Mycena leptocephala]|nr:hypothetical protein B0H13DRAFT_1929843 [Mycena leptocephala]
MGVSIFKRPNSPSLFRIITDYGTEAYGSRSFLTTTGKVWCCKGIVKEDAAHLGTAIPIYNFLGRDRVGGCLKIFLRRWDLEKHLYRPLNTCERDAIAMFLTCKHFLAISKLRTFWVYANIDVDFLQRPGRGRVDYSGMILVQLQARLLKAHRIFKAWRSMSVNPAHIHTISVKEGLREILLVPWTQIIVTMDEYTVRLRDWGSGASCLVPLELGTDMLVLSVKIFWVETIGQNVLIVAVSNGRSSPTIRNVLHFFAVDSSGPLSTFLAAVEFPHTLSDFSLSDKHLAVVGYTGLLSYFIQSLEISYDSPPSVSTKAAVRVGAQVCSKHFHLVRAGMLRSPQGTLAASSFAILDATHFLLANPAGLAVYRLSERTLASRTTRRIRACWEHQYPSYDLLPRPPLGPIVVDRANSQISITICSGNFIRRLFMTTEQRPQFRLSKQPLVERPVYLGIIGGFRTGIYRQPYWTTGFTTFQLVDATADLHPLASQSDPLSARGSVAYHLGDHDFIEPTSLKLDEGEGRIMFVQRTQRGHTCKHFFGVLKYRPVWVQVNIDIDFVLRRPGRGQIDYSGMTIADLKIRARKALHIFDAWRSWCANTRVIRTIPLKDGPHGRRRVMLVPWTRIMVLQEEDDLRLWDWNSQAESYTIPLELGSDMQVLALRVFWVESIRHSSGPSATHLTTVEFSFRLCISWMGSLTILDKTHFLLANSIGMAVYNLADDIPTSPTMPPIRACWEHRYRIRDIIPHPPLGPVLADPSNGQVTVSILGGNVLRRLSMTTGLQPQFGLCETILYAPRPHASMTAGLHIGIYRRSTLRTGFSTFPMHNIAEHLHPMASEPDFRFTDRGLGREEEKAGRRHEQRKMLSPGSQIKCLPLDTIFLILRLLTFQDVVAMFTTCKHFYDVSQYRPLWVYLNIDVDFLLRRPGRGHINYSEMTVAALKDRIRKAQRIFYAWRSPRTATKIARIIALKDGLDERRRKVALIPWSQIIVFKEEDAIHLHDLASQASIFWVDSIGKNVLMVMSSNRRSWADVRTDLHLFAIESGGPSATPLTTVQFPHWLLDVSLSENHLAVIGLTGPRSHFIHSFDVAYPSWSSTSTAVGETQVHPSHFHLVRAHFLMSGYGIVSVGSFIILDKTHFLLANPTGIAVYKLSENIPTSPTMTPIAPCWESRYQTLDIVPRPPLSPVVIDPSSGQLSLSVIGGNLLRRFSMTADRQPQFEVTESPLFDSPMHFSVTGGLHVGIYRRPGQWSMGFTTFPISDDTAHLHPFAWGSDLLHPIPKGSIVYPLGRHDTTESLTFDEAEGRIVFVERLQSRDGRRRTARIVVLEIV